jgi:hypothetical protein
MADKKMKKEFEHSGIEICNLCKKEIDTELDRWNVILEYYPREIGKGFYHQKCLNDLIKGKSKVIEENFKQKLQHFSQGMLKNIFPNLNSHADLNFN